MPVEAGEGGIDMALEGFGSRLKAVRQDRGYTQKQLAAALGVTEQAVSKWERENSYPDLPMLDGLSRVLECSLDFLFQVEAGRKNLLNQNSIERREEINGLLLPDIISLEFGYDLVPMFAGEGEKGFPHINEMRRMMASGWGVVIPPIRLRDNSSLPAREYQVRLNGIVVYADKQNTLGEDGLAQILGNLKEHIFQNIELVLNNQMVFCMVKNLREQYPYVVENVIPEKISYSLLRQVLAHMIKECGYTASPLILIIQQLEEYPDSDCMEPAKLAEEICAKMPEGYAFSRWLK